MSAKPIVAATDGSEESLRAVDWAAREAVLRGAPLRIVSAASLLPRMVGSEGHSQYQTVSDVIRKDSDVALTAAAARAAKVAPDLLIDTDHLEGAPAEAVTEAGSGALMLVVGSRGVGAFTAMILGSVSRYVATHASSPVVVVREEIGAARRQVGIGISDSGRSRGRRSPSRSKRRPCARPAWSPSMPGTRRKRICRGPGTQFTAEGRDFLQTEASRASGGPAGRMARQVP